MNIFNLIVKLNTKLAISIIGVLIAGNMNIFAQENSSHVNSKSISSINEQVFSTPNPKLHSSAIEKNMVKVNLASLFTLGASFVQSNEGIKGTVGDGGIIELTMYLYDKNKYNGKGNMLYSIYLDHSSPSITKQVHSFTAIHGGTISNDWEMSGDNIKGWVHDARAFGKENCNFSLAQSLSSIFGSIYPCEDPDISAIRSVIVEAKIRNATLSNFYLPLIGLKDGYFFKEATSLQVKVNDRVPDLVQPNTNLPLSLTMGDKISLIFHGLTQDHKPSIVGVPDTWIARFAGDVMYYCTPSIKPGGWRPWIGFDSRVHNLMVRKYPQGFKKKYTDWVWNAQNLTWTYEFYAKRRSDANKRKMDPLSNHIWPKYHLVNGKRQRRNQKEGLNMQYLNYWDKNWSSAAINGFKNYNGEVKYMLGYDDDELGYFNVKYNATSNPLKISTNLHIAKLEDLPWKKMPEGYEVLYDDQGFPSAGVPLNEMVTSYFLHKAEPADEANVPYYNGYEIQDLGTSANTPNGIGTGNVEHPGNVGVQFGSTYFSLELDVSAPLTHDKGFYGVIEGTEWPSYGEPNVPYTLTGLYGRRDLDNYILEYEWMDRLGNLTKITRYLKNKDVSFKNNVRNTGKWTEHFNLNKPSYSSITAYYQLPGEEPTMIAGKELKPIFVLMAGVKNMQSPNNTTVIKGGTAKTNFVNGFSEGDGHGGKIWQEDYRNTSNGEYNEARSFGRRTRYTKPYVREYVFRKGDQVTWTAFDGDPHLWNNSETEFYLGSRTIAKRTPEDSLLRYLKFKLKKGLGSYNKLTLERTGRTVKHTFNKTGTFDFKVEYRGTSNIKHRIKVVEYDGSDERAKIKWTPLSVKEAQWLGISNRDDYYTIAADDMLSNYKYDEGFRAFNGDAVDNNGTNPRTNRWALANDYAESYTYEVNYLDKGHHSVHAGLVGLIYEQPVLAVREYINSYHENVFKNWFTWKTFGLHFPSNWLRMNGPGQLQTFPPYVNKNDVIRLFKKGEDLDYANDYMLTNIFGHGHRPSTSPYQYVVPLLSYTNYQGWRSRTNPSCVYDIKYLFNSPNGAFSGNPILPTDPNSIQSPDYSDDYKDQQQFFHDLKELKLLVVDIRDNTILPKDVLAIRQHNPRKDRSNSLSTGSNRVTLLSSIPTSIANLYTSPVGSSSAPLKFNKQNYSIENTVNVPTTSVIFPNSSTGVFNIVAGKDLGSIKTITVTNVSGKQIFKEDYNKSPELNSATIDISGFPEGIYIVSLTGHTGSQIIKKIILK